VDVGTEIPPSFGSDSSGHPGNSPLCLCSGPGRGGPDAASAVTAVRIGRGFPRSPPDGPRRFSYRDPTRTGGDVRPSGVEAVHAPQRRPCISNSLTLLIRLAVWTARAGRPPRHRFSQCQLKLAGQVEDIDSSRQGYRSLRGGSSRKGKVSGQPRGIRFTPTGLRPSPRQ
jgi:hypothetical protein